VSDRAIGTWGTPRSSPVRLGRPRPGVRERALADSSPLRRLDWVLLLAVAAMTTMGGLLVWSATRARQLEVGADPAAYLKRHILNAAIGLCVAAAAALVDYRALRAYAPVVYVASILGLLAVLVIGSTINGAHSWIVLPGSFQLQPSEFAKVALVVGVAMILAERRDGEAAPRDVDVVVVLLFTAVPLGLIMLQPDFGTTMVCVFCLLGMIAVSGAPGRWVAGLALAGVLAGTLILTTGALKPYQRDRFTSFTQPGKALSTTAYNVDQAKTAIGSGGIFGKGLFHGTQTNGQFVPEQQTDFVFTVAGEELGFVGAGALVALLGVVLWRGLRIAQKAHDLFGTILAAGVVTWFAFQSFVNIGMTMGIMPVTGLPLPFVSYGGSSMFANLAAIGLLENVHMRTRSREP